MKVQEVVTIFSDIPNDATMKTYPELDEWFNKGMSIESFAQTQSGETGKYVITFLLRYYNANVAP